MKKLAVVVAVYSMTLVFVGASAPALAQAPAGQSAAVAAKSTGTAEGEIRRVDAAAKTITVKHGDFKGIDMPAMTMLFPVKDAKMLDGVKPGDRVKFAVEQSGPDLVVTKIEKAK